jgi:predicted permease
MNKLIMRLKMTGFFEFKAVLVWWRGGRMGFGSGWRRGMARVRSWVSAVSERERLEMEMEAELASHQERRAADLIAGGMAAAEAARRARVELGTALTHKEGMRASLGLRWWDELRADVRFGLRMLRKNPGFTAIAAGSLALAIGANTAIFSIAKMALYDRLGVPHPEQLRIVGWTGDEKLTSFGYFSSFDGSEVGMKGNGISYPVFQQIEAQNHTLAGIFAMDNYSTTGMIRGNPKELMGELLSGNAYAVLGLQPQLGRGIQPADDTTSGTGAVTVISDGLWRREFGGSPAVLGQTITVNRVALTIVGVNPREFTGTSGTVLAPDFYAPLSMQPVLDPQGGKEPSLLAQAGMWRFEAMARLTPDVRESTARADLEVEMAAASRATMKVGAGETVPKAVLADGSRGMRQLDMLREPINVLWGLVGLVLLLACANTANLLLARSARRQREMSVRLALGAGRGRVLRQMITESLLLASLGGALGLWLGYLAVNAIPGMLTFAPIPIHLNHPFDWTVCGFGAAVTVLTGLLFGLTPALSAARAEVSSNLKESAQTVTRRRKGLGGKALVGFQIALSTLLVIGAGLFVRSVVGLDRTDPGFRTDHLLLVDIDPPGNRYGPGKDIELHQQLEAAISAVPGVESVAPMWTPWLAGNMAKSGFETEAEVGARSEKKFAESAETGNVVGNEFFQTLGVQMIAGRSFGAQDTATSAKVGVINQSLARKRFGNGNAIGKRFSTRGEKGPWIEVVGICADTRFQDLRSAPPAQYFVLYEQQKSASGMTYAIRTHVRPELLGAALQKAVAHVDRDLPVSNIRTQQQQIDESMSTEIVLAAMTAGFGMLALALACVGIYGVMAYSVANRRNEIGIRMALGAQPGRVRRMILRESGWLAVVGIAVGVAAALGVTRVVKSMLFGVQPNDPATVVGGIAILLLVALAASWIPAARAARVQPMEALRHE